MRLILAVLIVLLVLAVAATLDALIYLGQLPSGTRTFSLTEPSNVTKLKVSDINGYVQVHQWSRSYVKVNGTESYLPPGVRVLVVRSGTALTVEVTRPALLSFLPIPFFVNLQVWVPWNLTASYSVGDVNGYVQLNLLNFTSLSASTVNGEVVLNLRNGGEALASTTNGEIDAAVGPLGKLSLQSVNGEVRLTLTSPVRSGSYLVSTVNGDVWVTLPGGSGASVSLATVNGDVKAFGNFTAETSSSTSFSGTLGGGGATFLASTTNGDVIFTG